MNAKDLLPVSESAKKPYTQPQIVFKQKLETMAATCTASTQNKDSGSAFPTACVEPFFS